MHTTHTHTHTHSQTHYHTRSHTHTHIYISLKYTHMHTHAPINTLTHVLHYKPYHKYTHTRIAPKALPQDQ